MVEHNAYKLFFECEMIMRINSSTMTGHLGRLSNRVPDMYAFYIRKKQKWSFHVLFAYIFEISKYFLSVINKWYKKPSIQSNATSAITHRARGRCVLIQGEDKRFQHLSGSFSSSNTGKLHLARWGRRSCFVIKKLGPTGCVTTYMLFCCITLKI